MTYPIIDPMAKTESLLKASAVVAETNTNRLLEAIGLLLTRIKELQESLEMHLE